MRLRLGLCRIPLHLPSSLSNGFFWKHFFEMLLAQESPSRVRFWKPTINRGCHGIQESPENVLLCKAACAQFQQETASSYFFWKQGGNLTFHQIPSP